MKDYVIYTVLTGDYDNITQPLVIDDRFDYILFTDNVSQPKIGVWEVRPITIHHSNHRTRSRYPKCLPSVVLSEYSSSLYMDANFQIIDDWIYKRYIECYQGKVEWASVKHPCRNNLYQEICDLLDLQWVHDYDTIEWYAKMKKDGYNAGNGLLENGIIFRMHTKHTEEAGLLWWDTLQQYCSRDQFSLMCVLWKTNIHPTFLFSQEECPRLKSVHIKYYNHNPHTRVVKLSINELLRKKCISVAPWKELSYKYLFDKLSRYKHPRIMLYMWEIYAIFAYGYKVIMRIVKRKLNLNE